MSYLAVTPASRLRKQTASGERKNIAQIVASNRRKSHQTTFLGRIHANRRARPASPALPFCHAEVRSARPKSDCYPKELNSLCD